MSGYCQVEKGWVFNPFFSIKNGLFAGHPLAAIETSHSDIQAAAQSLCFVEVNRSVSV